MNELKKAKTTNIVIAALGGEGGGVLVSWIETVANMAGWQAQATSIAGVAQRTGATIYYLELIERPAADAPQAVMSMFPTQGDIDIAIASEISEAGRLIQRGFCARDRTTLIASSHQIYSINEKMDLRDGSVDPDVVARIARDQSKKLIHFDMRALAAQNNTVISATLFGALAGSKALPFDKQAYLDVIAQTGKAVENNTAAFLASYNKAIAPALIVESAPQSKPTKTSPVAEAKTDAQSAQQEAFVLPKPTTEQGGALLDRVANEFPARCHEFIVAGLNKLIDYQDFEYAHQYLDELATIVALDSESQNHELSNEAARYLALWMCFEDTARVAQIKTRKARLAKVRDEVQAKSDQIIHTTEFFAPRLEEFCQSLPPKLAQWIMDSRLCNKLAAPFTKGKRLRTDTITIFCMMRVLAFTRHWRRKSWVYAHEYRSINRWLAQVKEYASTDYQAALELTECARIVKGYGATRHRTSTQINQILEHLKANKGSSSKIIALREAAFADDSNTAFEQALKA